MSDKLGLPLDSAFSLWGLLCGLATQGVGPLLVMALAMLVTTGCGEWDSDGDTVADQADCDPRDATVYPGAEEDCYDGIDNDCDGDTDWGDRDCASRSASGGWEKVFGYGDVFCAIRSDDGPVCWGCHQQEHDGMCNPPEAAFTDLAIGTNSVCGITTDHTAECWGCEGWSEDYVVDRGQCDAPDGEFLDITTGYGFSCAIDMTGRVTCWGGDYFGSTLPPEASFSYIDSSGTTPCGIRADGSLVCWGLGTDDVPESTESYSVISVGSAKCGVTTTGELACWGSDTCNFGWCDYPDGSFSDVAVESHFCALSSIGDATCWGTGVHGETASITLGFTDIAVGNNTTCGVLANGYLLCWGETASNASLI
jgi:hypothetical protein